MFRQEYISRRTSVTAFVASHTSKNIFYAKKIAERFFLASSTTRHSSLGRIDRGAHVTAVAASHTSEKKKINGFSPTIESWDFLPYPTVGQKSMKIYHLPLPPLPRRCSFPRPLEVHHCFDFSRFVFWCFIELQASYRTQIKTVDRSRRPGKIFKCTLGACAPKKLRKTFAKVRSRGRWHAGAI